ncbi:hypothetical protein ACFE04_019351 [Oxalis oulophora]
MENNNTNINYEIASNYFDLDEALMSFHIHHEDPSPNYVTTAPPATLLTYDCDTMTFSDGVCAVCMEGFENNKKNGKTVPCGHLYHDNCIATWFSKSNSCPLCRCDISSNVHQIIVK